MIPEMKEPHVTRNRPLNSEDRAAVALLIGMIVIACLLGACCSGALLLVAA